MDKNDFEIETDTIKTNEKLQVSFDGEFVFQLHDCSVKQE